MADLPHALPATVTELTDDSVTLSFRDGQNLRWPKRLLPENVTNGERVHLLALPDDETDAARRELAKQVLNEMLRGS